MAENKAQLSGSSEIRANIDETRATLDLLVNALANKLTPNQLLLEGWELLKSGSGSGANKLAQVAREHPLPSVVIGVGLGLLVMEQMKGSETTSAGSAAPAVADTVSDVADHLKTTTGEASEKVKSAVTGVAHKASEAASQAAEKVSAAATNVTQTTKETAQSVKETASHLADAAREETAHLQEKAAQLKEQTRHRVKDARIGFWQTMDANPLAVLAGAVAVGLAIGLAVPGTRREDELLGETRDQLLEDAKEKGHELLDRGKQVATTAARTAKDVAAAHGLTAAAMADKAKAAAQQTSEAVRAVGRETTEAVRTEVASMGTDTTRDAPKSNPAHMYNKTEGGF